MPRDEGNTIDEGATTVADDKASKAEGMSNEQLEDKTTERMAELIEGKSPEENTTDTEAESKTSDDSTPDPDKKTGEEESTNAEDESTPESEAKAEEQTTDDKKIATEEEADKDKGKEKEEEIPQLPDVYYQAAIHRGISKEDIVSFYKANPEQCVKAYGNIYEAVRRSGEEFAAQGRVHKEQVAREAELANAPQKTEESEFVGVDIEALEKTEIDPDVLEMLRAMNDQSEKLHNEVQALKAVPGKQLADTSAVDSQEVALIQQQIGNFFTSDETKPYAEFYGVVPATDVDWAALSPGQLANRFAVINMMDDILLGAELNKREMSIDNAMQVAHLNVSESQRTKVIREELKASVTKRSKSLSLKPSSTSKTESTTKKTEEEFVETTQGRLDKLFKG